MGGLASKQQLRMSFMRWAIVTVPLILVLGFLAGASVASGGDAAWYVALIKPAITPPAWVFPVAWTILYVMMGIALAMILNARGAAGRWIAVALFVVQLACNLAWTPVFFGAHKIGLAFVVTIAMFVFTLATTILFGRIRPTAAWLMVPYLVWISFAGVLTWRIDRLNPNAQSLVPGARTTQLLD